MSRGDRLELAIVPWPTCLAGTTGGLAGVESCRSLPSLPPPPPPPPPLPPPPSPHSPRRLAFATTPSELGVLACVNFRNSPRARRYLAILCFARVPRKAWILATRSSPFSALGEPFPSLAVLAAPLSPPTNVSPTAADSATTTPKLESCWWLFTASSPALTRESTSFKCFFLCFSFSSSSRSRSSTVVGKYPMSHRLAKWAYLAVQGCSLSSKWSIILLRRYALAN